MILYKLTFANGKSYIGITSCSLERRLSLHRSHAKREKRGILQRAIRKYGPFGFTSEIIERSDDWKSLCNLEKTAIVLFNTLVPNGYNLTMGGEGTSGFKMRSDQIKRSLQNRRCTKGRALRPVGWKHSEEARRKISEAGKGRIFSEERKSKIGNIHRGNKYNLGKVCPVETRNKISKTQKGRIFSQETREKMRLAALRRYAK